MAGSDDKPEGDSSEAESSEAGAAAEETGRRREDATTEAEEAEPDTPREDVGREDEGAAEAEPEKGDPDADTGADGTTPPEPVAPGDAPSGDVPEADATLALAEPLKAGPTERGADSIEGETDAEAAEAETAEDVPDLTDPAEPEAVTAAPAAAPQKASAIPMIFGGVIAGLIGFGAAWAIWGQDSGTSELSARIEAQADAMKGLETAVEGKAPAEALAALEARVAAVEAAPAADTSGTDATVAAQAEALAALATRIEALEKAPVEGSADPAAQAALAAYGREVEALRKEVAAQMSEMNAALEAAKETEAEAAARQEEAAAAAARAAEQRALLDVRQALDTGAPYSEALGRISSAEIPEGLGDHAAEGVMTLDALKQSFPAAARSALRASREAVAGEDGGGFGSWLTRQVGARSLEPKEGDDPDAVLSRAEAALAAGDLETALGELAALPETGQTAMDQWIAHAKRRNDAVTGADALAATLTSN